MNTKGVKTRNFTAHPDVGRWLELRQKAFATEKPAIGKWDPEHFRREFLSKDWWHPGRMWFAESNQPGHREDHPVGTVTLAVRRTSLQSRPVIHWLAVLPGFRRRGIGRLLIATLETACWDAGGRTIWLESHSGWAAAIAFYTSLGYTSEEFRSK